MARRIPDVFLLFVTLLLVFGATTAFALGRDLAPAWRTEGFSQPDSALYVPSTGYIYVSNMNGEPWSVSEGGGFISRLTVDGALESLTWAGSADPASALRAPKGLAAVGDRLYVADVDRLVALSLATGAVLQTWTVTGARLNDVVPGPAGSLFVSDSSANAVLLLRDSGAGLQISTWYFLDSMPEGLALRSGTLYAALPGVGVEGVDLTTKEHFAIVSDTALSPDGLALDEQGQLFFSSGASILARDSETASTVLLTETGTPADISIAEEPGYLLSPDRENGVTAYAATTPPPPISLTQVVPPVIFAAGDQHALALVGGEQLWGFGDNNKSEVGYGLASSVTTPTRLDAQHAWRSVAGGLAHSLGVRSDKTLWAWGYNEFGQCGQGTSGLENQGAQIVSPAKQVGQSTGWLAASGGGEHSLGVLNGDLYGWGGNEWGQVGVDVKGLVRIESTPRLVSFGGSAPWARVSAGWMHSLGIRSDGSLWTWGLNDQGQLGLSMFPDAIVDYRSQPQPLADAGPWLDGCAGAYHSAAVRADGSLWTWGWNQHGELGVGPGSGSDVPVRVGQDADWTAVSCGDWYNLALKSDGSLWSWGYNLHGELGLGNTTNRSTPQRVGSGANWTAISAGRNFSLALQGDGSLWGFGDNVFGQLGQPMSQVFQALTPVQIPIGEVHPAAGVVGLSGPVLLPMLLAQ